MLGLALEGGGAKGAFHMGAVKAFFEEGYQFSGITGTSIGALNGAIIAQGDFETGYQIWENIDNSLLFGLEKSFLDKITQRRIDKETIFYLTTKIKEFIGNKGIDTSKIKGVIESIIDEEKLRNSPIDFGLVTVSLSDMKPLELFKEDIPQGQMMEYLMSSASLPGFKMERIEGKYFLDGAFYDNCPINLLAGKGYKEIIAIRTFSFGITQDIKYPDVKLTTVKPSEDLGGILNFDSSLIQRNLLMGYFDAQRVMKGLKGKKYYIQPVDEDFFFHALYKIPDEEIKHLGTLFGLREAPPKRMLFEKMIPFVARNLGLNSSASYQDIIISLFEELAENEEVEKYKIYTLDQFLTEIRKIPPDRENQKTPRFPTRKLAKTMAAQTILNIFPQLPVK
ncbi:MAG: patatin-like phospholipase family protein [Dehalobacterium sp.]|jgi:NTE family protein